MTTSFYVRGQVSIDGLKTKAGLQVNLYDADRVTRDDPLGVVETDEYGTFSLRFSSTQFADEYRETYPDMRVEVILNGKPLPTQFRMTQWQLGRYYQSATLYVNAQAPHDSAFLKLHIDSVEALQKHEPQIVETINEIKNGGLMFSTDPFGFLEDLGVTFTEDFKKQLLSKEPRLKAPSRTTHYQAIKRSTFDQRYQVTIKRLFNI